MRRILLVVPWLLPACTGDVAPTWAKDIAPLVYQHCTPCHRAGEAAPFRLECFDDARKKAALLAEVTADQLMPPWLPTHGEFVGDRRLTAAQIELMQRWVAGGAQRGAATLEPPAPQFPAGWQLREPDLVLATDELIVPADGGDVLRNLVVKTGIEQLRYVMAVEIRPASRAVHHAVLAVDATSKSRALDALDAEPGFPGMVMGNAVPPDGHFLGWTPGKRVSPAADGMAFRLLPGQDLVLQLHLQPTGKQERERTRIGLYFTEQAPTAIAMPLVLWSDRIDLAPGVKDYLVQDEFVLPVPATLHALYPHAHYLGKRLRGLARLPDGSERVLFAIDRWDFDWQDDYQLRAPLPLPAGTKLRMEYVFDNSAANANNPSQPPVRVQFGQGSRDEMATLTLSLTFAERAERRQAQHALLQHDLRKSPEAGNLWLELAGVERLLGNHPAAEAAMRNARRFHPDTALVEAEWGLCVELAGNLHEAEQHYRVAIAEQSTQPLANAQLGTLLARRGEGKLAREHFRTALVGMPNVAALHANFALASLGEGDATTAQLHFGRAIALDPEHFAGHLFLGRILFEAGDREAAVPLLRRAVALRPQDAGARTLLDRAQGELLSLSMEPLLGHCDATTAHVFARAAVAGQYRMDLRAEGVPGHSAVATADADHDLTLHFAFAGLTENTKYRIQMWQGERQVALRSSWLTTGCLPTARQATVAFGSCSNDQTFPEQSIWPRISARQPDALVLLGDTPYIDNGLLEVRRRRHREFLSFAPVREVIATIPTWTTWDDHDFALNDMFGAVPGSDKARQVFVEYHAHAGYGDGERGIYTSFRRGPLEVFLLDTRSFADTEPSLLAPDERSALGSKQLQWLQAGLQASTATFKVLACGMVWNGGVRPKKLDCWGHWLAERDALWRWLGAANVTGVVLLSGDVHRSRVILHPTKALLGYDLPEFITSPLAQNVLAANKVDVPGLEFDAGEAESCMFLAADLDRGAGGELVATFQAGDGRIFHERKLSLADLSR